MMTSKKRAKEIVRLLFSTQVMAANIDKIKKNLKWKPKVKFKNGLRKTMNFYKENNEI